MKKFLALFAVVVSFALSTPAFAQNHHGRDGRDGNGRGGVNLQVSPWGTSLNIGGRHGVTINDGRGRWDNRGWDNRGWNNGYRGPVVIIPVPRRDYRYDRGYNGYDRSYGYDRGYGYGRQVLQRPYYYFDRYDREVYVDQYGRSTYTGNYRGGRDCDCN